LQSARERPTIRLAYLCGNVAVRVDRLLLAESLFLREYPDAFASPALADIGKRHPIARLTQQAQEALAEPRFRRPGMSSMVCRAMIVHDLSRGIASACMAIMPRALSSSPTYW
jgi:hypothetical protein